MNLPSVRHAVPSIFRFYFYKLPELSTNNPLLCDLVTLVLKYFKISSNAMILSMLELSTNYNLHDFLLVLQRYCRIPEPASV